MCVVFSCFVMVESVRDEPVRDEEVAFWNLRAFSEYCWPEHLPNADFHNEIYDTLMYKTEAGKRFKETRQLHVEAPRYHAKTTCVSVKYVLWRIGRNPNIRVVVISRTGALAQDINREVRRNIENNPWYAKVFLGLRGRPRTEGRPDAPWGDERFQVGRPKIMKDATFYGTGLEGSVTGIRADLLILDDPFDLNEVRTEAQRAKVKEWINSVTISILPPQGELIVIGTRWAEGDYYGGLLEKSIENGGNWVCMVYRAIENYEDEPEDWRLLWPEAWTPEALVQRREIVGDRMFASLYQNDPAALKGALFKEDKLTYYDPEFFARAQSKYFEFVMAVDPAISEDSQADRTAIVTVACDLRNKDIYVLDVWAERVGFPVQVEKIVEYASRNRIPGVPFLREVRIRKVGVESTAYQKALYSSLYDKGLPVEEVKHARRSKWERILGLQPHFENGRIRLPKGVKTNWIDKFMSEYTNYPVGKHDDILDALETAVGLTLRSGGESSMGVWLGDDRKRLWGRGVER